MKLSKSLITVFWFISIAYTASPYIFRKAWVRNYVKFQYTFGNSTGRSTGDIKPIAYDHIYPAGCVPSNTNDGEMIKIGATYNETDFQYVCAESEDGIVSYEATDTAVKKLYSMRLQYGYICIQFKACIDPDGEIMKIGEAITMRDGTLLLACQLHGGVIKKTVQQFAFGISGCLHNDTLYGESETWVEPLKVIMKKQNSLMTAVLMQCFRPHYSYFEAQIAGCVAGDTEIPLHSYEYIDGQYVHCVELDSGELDLVKIKESDLSCALDDKKYEHNETWFDEGRAAVLTCLYREIIKLGHF
ncbi:unnamed protein product [Enterobius vermicularis]|uniref:Uncharacterized protein n=1 Tax=Enterobius vermicularis TaxID=51028 RepID=A0A0N4UV84_ENTVE|nr:unnamed protein product [Enterobius vermicularis]